MTVAKYWDGSTWRTIPAIQGPPGPTGPPGVSTALPARDTTTFTVAVAAGADAEYDLTLFAGIRLLRVQVNKPARVRAYPDDTYRDADLLREPGTDPTADHGVLLDIRFGAADLDYRLSPPTDLYTTSGSTLRFQVRNEGSTANVDITLTYIRTE